MMTATKPKTKKDETLKESEKKWGATAIKAGFSVLPNTLLTKQHALGLDCIDLVLVFQIHKHWWHAGNAPFPSQVQLAKTMNTDLSTVKRHLNRLRAAGLISWTERHTKHKGRAANVYDLSGLIAEVQKFAEAEIAEREKQATERQASRKRKRPHLRVVSAEDGEGDDNE